MLAEVRNIDPLNLINAAKPARIMDQQINYSAASLLVTRWRLGLNERLNKCLDLGLPRLQSGKDLACD